MSILAATGLAVVAGLVSATPAHAISDVVLGSGTNLISTDFEHADNGGKRLLLLSTTNGCTGSFDDVDYQIGGMPTDWNDKVSSFENYFQPGPLFPCNQKLYENSNFNPGGGKTFGYHFAATFVGTAMNDATTSIRWS